MPKHGVKFLQREELFMNKMRFGVLALAFLCLPSAAAAAPIDRVTVDAEAKTLTISGSNIKNFPGSAQAGCGVAP